MSAADEDEQPTQEIPAEEETGTEEKPEKEAESEKVGGGEEEEEEDDEDFAVVKKDKKKDKKKKKKEKKDKKGKKRKVQDSDDEEVKEEVKEEVDEEEEIKSEPVDENMEKEIDDQMDQVFDEEHEEAEWRRVLENLGGDDGDELNKELRKEATADAATEEKKPANKQAIDSITLTRTQDVAPHCQLFFFQKLVVGAFARCVVENNKSSHATYALFEIENAVPSGVDEVTGAALTYKVNNTVTDWVLICKSGRHTRKVKLSSISNEKCTEEEYLAYMQRMDRHGLPVITRKRASEKRAQIWKLYSDYYRKPLTGAQVDEIVATRKRLRGKASVNLVRNKLHLERALETLAMQRQADDAAEDVEFPEEYKEMEAEFGADFAWKKYYEDMELKKRRLEFELEETEKKLQSVLYGQNSSFETLAKLTHRNAAANKGRVEATDPIDTIVFGRKEGRSGKSYWSVSEGGFAEKKKEIDQFWVEKKEKEQTEVEATRAIRRKELQVGTCPIKDLDAFTKEVGKEDLSQVERQVSMELSQPSQQQTNPAKRKKKGDAGGAAKMSVADFLARKKK